MGYAQMKVTACNRGYDALDPRSGKRPKTTHASSVASIRRSGTSHIKATAT
jgi:hypothetical protein